MMNQGTSARIFYNPASDAELSILTVRLRNELKEHFSFAPKSISRLEEVVLGTLGMPNGRQQWKALQETTIPAKGLDSFDISYLFSNQTTTLARKLQSIVDNGRQQRQKIRESESSAKPQTSRQDKWNDDSLQFARLVAEFSMASDHDNVSLQEVAESMDLELPEIFELFARAETAFEEIKAELKNPDSDTPMNFEKALEDLENADELKLWECEIGLFDLENDPNTAVKSFVIVVAAESPDEANEEAQNFAEENIAIVRDMAFSGMEVAREVSPSDYQ
jgi:hypothetical protein